VARYAITIFLSAFLLFQVQPIIGKFILPWFGGGPGVWTTCMLFFQVALLGGYSYAHLIANKLSGRSQTIVHVGLLVLSLAFLPIIPDAEWKATAGEDAPIARILTLLALTIGLPYFLLSSTGPLLQESFRRETGRTPYRLYSLSNVGSLLALLTYPFVFEPQLSLRVQILAWSAGYVAFVVCCAWCATAFTKAAHPLAAVAGLETADEPGHLAGKPTLGDVLLWLGLAACGSSMLLATTNQLCQEVSAVPFLWVVPLAIYLISFIVCFDHERWYHRNSFLVLLGFSVVGAVYAISEGNSIDMWYQLAIYSGVLFVACMVCHGELVRAKPAAQYATLFYLMVSAGGALGGVLVGIGAPLVLNDFWEYHVAIVATVLLAFIATFRLRSQPTLKPRRRMVAGGAASIAIGLLFGWWLTYERFNPETGTTNLETTRNFYGVLHVEEREDFNSENGPKRELVHGRIEHGFQYLDPGKRREPTTYYGRSSGVGLAIDRHPHRAAETDDDRKLRIGVVGLGCGTLAAYGKPGDSIRFYEINPAVERISSEYFTYRHDSEAQVDVILGDARIRMEQEIASGQPQQFDVLAIDAFSSDAIPMHLLTRECVEVFRQSLKPDGLLCLHISNRFLDLSSVARGAAEALGWPCVRIVNRSDEAEGLSYSNWVVLTKNQQFLDDPEVAKGIAPWTEKDPAPVLWTDDYASLWHAIDRS
jgi:hypothetical protein